jgi:3-carboxy-cis,cis-muconate cycloisomerase
MAASILDSSLYRELLHDAEIGALFGDRAEVDALVRVEAALARAQGELGVIPQHSAAHIVRVLPQLNIDPASLATGTGVAGIPIPALLETLREAMQAPDHARYLHWGATSQDIMDTALVLRLREVCDIVDVRLRRLLGVLANLAEQHAALPLAARTRRQPATPTAFGAVVAGWGAPLLSQLDVLAQLRPRLLRVSLAGASGNSAALGDTAAAVRAALAAELELGHEVLPWHCDRTALAEFSACLARINGALAKLAEDCMLAAQAEVGELLLAGGGGSSTMPQKQNPVQAEVVVSLFQLCAALDGAMTQALPHRQQRDGAAWMLEWHALPQVCLACGRSLQLAISMVTGLRPVAERMHENLQGRNGLIHAEAISFRLAELMPRPDAQAQVKQLCADAVTQECDLLSLLARDYPQIDWQAVTAPPAQLGDAIAQARAFVAAVRKL